MRPFESASDNTLYFLRPLFSNQQKTRSVDVLRVARRGILGLLKARLSDR